MQLLTGIKDTGNSRALIFIRSNCSAGKLHVHSLLSVSINDMICASDQNYCKIPYLRDRNGRRNQFTYMNSKLRIIRPFELLQNWLWYTNGGKSCCLRKTPTPNTKAWSLLLNCFCLLYKVKTRELKKERTKEKGTKRKNKKKRNKKGMRHAVYSTKCKNKSALMKNNKFSSKSWMSRCWQQ